VSSWKVSSLAARNKCQPRKSARFETTLLSRSRRRRSPRESESSFRNEETRFTPNLPITLHAALVAVGASLCTLWITMLSIDSIRLDSTRNPTPHAFTRAHLYPTIVTSFRLSTSKDPSRPSSSVSLGVTHSSFREFTLRVDVVIVMLWHFHGTRGIRRWKFLHDEHR